METNGKVEYDYEYMEDGVNINHFLVEPEHRQEGHGRRTLDNLVKKFDQEGYNYVVINMKGGEIAVKFLESCGFDIVEKSNDHVTGEREL